MQKLNCGDGREKAGFSGTNIKVDMLPGGCVSRDGHTIGLVKMRVGFWGSAQKR